MFLTLLFLAYQAGSQICSQISAAVLDVLDLVQMPHVDFNLPTKTSNTCLFSAEVLAN